MSLEYEINQYIEKIRKTLFLQKNQTLKDFSEGYLPRINVSVFTEDEDDFECLFDSLYFNDVTLTSDGFGSAS
ncbi:MAG: hypothetical protein ACTSQY_08555 [Candidatus Odinarchaeia archaeon]